MSKTMWTSMRLRMGLAATFFMTMFPHTALADVPIQMAKPGAFKTFSDWSVVCDNIQHCRAQGLMAQDDDRAKWLSLDFDRAGEADAKATLSVTIPSIMWPNDWPKNAAGPVNMWFVTDKGKVIRSERTVEYPPSYRKSLDGHEYYIDYISYEGLARPRWKIVLDGQAVSVLRDAKRLKIQDVNGKTFASASLQGLTKTLRYMDEQQGRTGGVTAFVVRGPKAASAVPAARSAPLIRKISNAAPLSDKPAYQPSEAEWNALYERGACDDLSSLRSSVMERKSIRMDRDHSLLFVPCAAGAYNQWMALFVAQDGGESSKSDVIITPARFDHNIQTRAKEGEAITLITHNFNQKTQKLAHHYKSRGPGDCGHSAAYFWQGDMFRLVEKNEMNECRGTTNQLRSWTAETVMPPV